MLKKNELIKEETQSYTSNEVSSGMVRETKKDNVVVRSHFKSRTQDEISVKIAEILAKLINRELETIK